MINITQAVDMKPGADDVIPSRVMNTILGSGFSGRLFQNLREDKAYTYGAYSSLGSDELVGRFGASASVRNEVTDSAIVQFMIELNKMRDTDVTDEELTLAKNYIAGSFARSLESPQTVAGFALSTARYDLPEDYYSTYLKKLEAVDVAAVRAMANKYIQPENAHIIVVGNKDEVAEKLGQFAASGEVLFFDIYGKEMAPAEDAGDVTGETVINKYIEAIGGKEAVEGVKSLMQKKSASVMGQDLVMVEHKMAPNKLALTVSMSGQTMMRQVYNGETGYAEQMGQKVDLEGDLLEQAEVESRMFTELSYLSEGYELEVGGVEEVNGEKCYKVVAKSPNGSTGTYYYGVESGLKVRAIETAEMQGQQVTTTQEFSDYKEVSGVKFPHSQKVTGGPMPPMDFKLESIEVNSKFDASVFQ